MAAETFGGGTEEPFYVNLLAVLPGSQRRGIGQALMDVVFAEAEKEGVGLCLGTQTLANVSLSPLCPMSRSFAAPSPLPPLQLYTSLPPPAMD